MFVLSFVDYPGKAVDDVAIYSGPLFSNVLEGKTYNTVNSFMDIMALPQTSTAIPSWRLAYLSGELVCRDGNDKEEEEVSITRFSGLLLGREGVGKMMAVCGEELGTAFISLVDVLEKPACSTGKRPVGQPHCTIYNIVYTYHNVVFEVLFGCGHSK